MEQLLSIEVLQRDLANAERELAKATADRLRTADVENQWQTEVTSLKNLITVRKQRLSPAKAALVIPSVEDGRVDGDGSGSFALPLNEDGELNRVDWIDSLIAASGTIGVAPPEILRKAEQAHLKMHPNYPYVVLRKLVEKERAVKRRGRYYKK